jgi:hypothetical protein
MQRGRNHLPGKSPWKTTPSPLRKPVGEPYSGTDPKRLWLLRSRPDQVHRRTMRRGPPSKILAELRVARSASLLLGGPRGAVCAPPPRPSPRGGGGEDVASLVLAARFALPGWLARLLWLGLVCLVWRCLALPWLALPLLCLARFALPGSALAYLYFFTSLGSLRFAWLCPGLPCFYFAWLAPLCLPRLLWLGLPWLGRGAATGLSRRGRGGSRGRRGLCGRPGR